MDPKIVARYKALQNEYLRFAENDNILELFPQVDLMCSDTSSALNEFLLTYKPVVTFKNRRPGPQLIDIDDPAQFEPAVRRALSDRKSTRRTPVTNAQLVCRLLLEKK